jgi:hypothetical protein
MHAVVIGVAVLQFIGAGPRPAQPEMPRIPTPAEVGAQEVTYTANYYKRLDVHRVASYTLLPLAALQVAAGLQLYEHGSEAPNWAKVGHRIGATGIAALFVTNVATGIPNLIAGRKDPNDRARRFTHATLMLAASVGFTATGLLSERAEGSADDREMHRTVALTSVALATVGYATMLDVFRRER